LLALLVGLAVGLLNGIGVAVFRVQPLIMTLGMGLVVSGVLLVYSLTVNHQGPPNVPDILRVVGSRKLLDIVPVSSLLWAAIATIVIVGLRQTGIGRLVYAVGDNPQACRLAGVRTWLVLLITYVICGFLSGVAGLVLTGSINGVDLSLGTPFLLPSVAAVVIGGTSIYGGSGGYSGTLLGALILTVLGSLFTLLDAPDPLKQVLYGAIVVLLAAVYVRTAGDT
ncbi:MAG: ABC transporter permease, partial [Candidatus Dormibacteraeota bacterium]|nr:ABC transporter permease [Candidatus Dormibacteraeota bacterium]